MKKLIALMLALVMAASAVAFTGCKEIEVLSVEDVREIVREELNENDESTEEEDTVEEDTTEEDIEDTTEEDIEDTEETIAEKDETEEVGRNNNANESSVRILMDYLYENGYEYSGNYYFFDIETDENDETVGMTVAYAVSDNALTFRYNFSDDYWVDISPVNDNTYQFNVVYGDLGVSGSLDASTFNYSNPEDGISVESVSGNLSPDFSPKDVASSSLGYAVAQIEDLLENELRDTGVTIEDLGFENC